MVHKKQQNSVINGDSTTYKEEVLFNSDTLSKVISYLPSIDVLNLALTSKRFGISVDDELSVIKESIRISVRDIATEEQLAALPHYDGESSLADYHYLQLMREPLTFDRLVTGAEYVDVDDRSCVKNRDYGNGFADLATAFSNNIMRAGKHYVTFEMVFTNDGHGYMGVMRPGQAGQKARGFPCSPHFYRYFELSPHSCNYHNDNNIQSCVYYTGDGNSYSSKWLPNSLQLNVDGMPRSPFSSDYWLGREGMSSGDEIGMLLDLDEGTLTVYKNGRKLGVMMRGLAGPYCWVVSILSGVQATIKRGAIPPT